jgi:hypothetical protein
MYTYRYPVKVQGQVSYSVAKKTYEISDNF